MGPDGLVSHVALASAVLEWLLPLRPCRHYWRPVLFYTGGHSHSRSHTFSRPPISLLEACTVLYWRPPPQQELYNIQASKITTGGLTGTVLEATATTRAIQPLGLQHHYWRPVRFCTGGQSHSKSHTISRTPSSLLEACTVLCWRQQP